MKDLDFMDGEFMDKVLLELDRGKRIEELEGKLKQVTEALEEELPWLKYSIALLLPHAPKTLVIEEDVTKWRSIKRLEEAFSALSGTPPAITKEDG